MHSLTHINLTKVAWDEGNSPSVRQSVVDVVWDESTFFPIFSLFFFFSTPNTNSNPNAKKMGSLTQTAIKETSRATLANGKCKRPMQTAMQWTKGNGNSTRQEKVGVRGNSPLDSNVVQVFPPLLIQSAIPWKKKEMKRNSTCVHVLMYPCIHVLSLFSGTRTKMEQRHL